MLIAESDVSVYNTNCCVKSGNARTGGFTSLLLRYSKELGHVESHWKEHSFVRACGVVLQSWSIQPRTNGSNLLVLRIVLAPSHCLEPDTSILL